MSRSLLLNFTPIEIHGEAVHLQTIPFEDPQGYRSLRAKLRGLYALTRRGNQVVALPLQDGLPSVGESETADVSKHLSYVRPLLEQRLVDLLIAKGRPVARYNPITTVGRILPTGIAAVDEHIHLQTRVPISIRFLKGQRGETLGLLWDLEIQKSCATNLAELSRLGFNANGLVVERAEPGADDRLIPQRRVVGKLGSVQGETGSLSERYSEADDLYSLSDLYLEASPENVRRLLRHFAGRGAEQADQKIAKVIFDNSRGSARLEHIQRLANWAAGLGIIELQPGLGVSIGPLVTQADADTFPRFSEVAPPTYVFDSGTLKSETRAAVGLGKWGPFSRHVFTPSKPNVCVIVDRSKRGQFEMFLRKFRDGLTTETDSRTFGRGFLGIYGLQDISFTFVEAGGFTADAYYAAASNAIRMAADGNAWHLAIVQTEGSSKQLPPQQNPYLVAKAAFLSNQVPTQFVTTETMGMRAENLIWAMSNLALAVYAKLGGIPWLIKSDKGISHEVVIGLGSAAIGESRFSRKERIVGITSVFRGDGGYLLSNLSNAVPIARYGEALTESLLATLRRVQAEMNWMKGESVRVVVHAFKPMRNTEIDAVKAALKEFGQFDLRFAFLHVKEDHPFLLFDDASAGVKGRGEKTPVRGLYAEVGEREALLTLTGPQQLKRATDGMPKPLLLSLHRDSTFTDIVYLTKQVFWFSNHSWRSFLPAAMPVTIYYSDLVAGLLGRLDKLGSRWSPTVMFGKIGTTRWFL